MRLKIGAKVRPNNEAVSSISYTPVFDQARRMVGVMERWDTTGRIVLQSGGQSQMTIALNTLLADIAQSYVDLVYLEDPPSNAETSMALKVTNCLQGPYVVDAGLPNQADDVYSTGMGYRVIWEAMKPYGQQGNAILEFQEIVTADPGGEVYTMVGGVVNWAERQLAMRHKPYRYVQSGSALGLYAYPRIPPPLWPFALETIEPRITLISPRNVGPISTHWQIQWEYRYAWHTALYGSPHISS